MQDNSKQIKDSKFFLVKKKLKEKQTFIILILIILLALFWRIYEINVFPKGLSNLELGYLRKMADISKNHWFIQAPDITNAIYLYLFAFLGKITAFNILLLRIFQVLIGTLTVYLFYLFAKEWFNKQIALLSALFLAVTSFHVAVSRVIEPAILTPLFIILLSYLLTIALRTGRKINFLLLGLFSALAFYVDKLFIFLPVLLIVFFVYFYYKTPKVFLKYWLSFIVFSVPFVLFLLPYLFLLPINISKIANYFDPGSFGQYFLNLGGNAQSLVYQSVPNQLFYVGLEPILSPFLAITFIVGIIYVLFHIDRRQYFYVFVLFLALLGTISLTNRQQTVNLLSLLPLALIFSSVILSYFLQNWLKTFPINQTAKIFLAFMLSIFIFLTVYYNYEAYFFAWGKSQAVQKLYTNTFDYKK
ncbi:MAG: glycosyltransferase family 39 protein [Patescibacteria group bacterium]|nr:glycosyltransferase family 39 protein [Patescibacteria group bacterium]